jgi:hypothetical protein
LLPLMRRTAVLLLLIAAGCSKGPQADLQYIAEARSLAAEWAMVNEKAAQGKLTAGYVSAMRSAVRQQLQSASSALTEPNSEYAREIKGLAAEPVDAAPQRLRAYSDRLKQIEDQLESA